MLNRSCVRSILNKDFSTSKLVDMREEAMNDFPRDIFTSDCIFLSSLLTFWNSVKQGTCEATRDLRIFNHRSSVIFEDSYVLEKVEGPVIRALRGHNGKVIRAKLANCERKDFNNLSIREFKNFVWPLRSNEDKEQDKDIFTGTEAQRKSFIYISVPEDTNFNDFIESLSLYKKLVEASARKNKQIPKRLFIWTKALCEESNIFENLDFNFDSANFKNIFETFPTFLNIFNHRLYFINDWKKPNILTNPWCIYEMYFGFENDNNSATLVYSRGTHENFGDLFNCTDKYEETDEVSTKTLNHVHIKSLIEHLDPMALVGCPENLLSVLTSIFSECPNGFYGVINVLKQYFINLLARLINNTVYEAVRVVEDSQDPKKVKIIIRRIRKTGIWMREAGELNASQIYLGYILSLCQEISSRKKNVPFDFLCKVQISLARSFKEAKDHKQAMALLEKTYATVNEVFSKKKAENLLRLMNILKAEISASLENYEECIDLYEDAINSLNNDTNSILARATVKFAKRSFQNKPASRIKRRKASLWATVGVGNGKMIDKLDKDELSEYRRSTILKIKLAMSLANVYQELKDYQSSFNQYLTAKEDLEMLGLDEFIEMGHVQIGIADGWMRNGQVHTSIKHLNIALNVFQNTIGNCNPEINTVHRKLGFCKEKLSSVEAVEHKDAQDLISRVYFGGNDNL